MNHVSTSRYNKLKSQYDYVKNAKELEELEQDYNETIKAAVKFKYGERVNTSQGMLQITGYTIYTAFGTSVKYKGKLPNGNKIEIWEHNF